ncbi:MAG TPA: hypothetical protein VGT61_13550 [Thermomicrobiales bacterium]|nr:hypothetical protein [Thermomicrobiales bacterium]
MTVPGERGVDTRRGFARWLDPLGRDAALVGDELAGRMSIVIDRGLLNR